MEALPWSGNRAWITGWPSHGNTWQAGRVIQPISPSAQVTCQQRPACGRNRNQLQQATGTHLQPLAVRVGLLLFCSDEDGTHTWQTLFLIHPPPLPDTEGVFAVPESSSSLQIQLCTRHGCECRRLRGGRRWPSAPIPPMSPGGCI